MTAERFAIIKSKIKYNAISVPQQNAISLSLASEEHHRGAVSGIDSKGCGLYGIASYISHSCEPNAKFEFLNGDHTLSVVALKDLQEGDELFVSYVSPDLSKKQRKKLIMDTYGFVCKCPKCTT